MRGECFRDELRERVKSSRWFHAALLLSGTVFLPILTGIMINMYTAGTYPGSGYVLLFCAALQLVVGTLLIVREHQIREPAVILMEAEDKCRDLIECKRELARRDEAYRMVRSAFDALNKQYCDMRQSTCPFSEGLRPIIEKFTASIWTALGCTSNRYTIEAYFDDELESGDLQVLSGHPMVFFAGPIVKPHQAVQLGNRHPAILNWQAGGGRDVNEIGNLPAFFFEDGKRSSLLYFNRYAVVTIPTQCANGRLGLLVLTAEQEEPFAANVLDTLDFLATIISAYNTKYQECWQRHKEFSELQAWRSQGAAESGTIFQIERATYGQGDTQVDVTDIVRALVRTAPPYYSVENENLGQDPLKCVAKELMIEYSVGGGSPMAKILREHELINLWGG